MSRLESSLFDWLTWRAGSPTDTFQLGCRSYDLLSPTGLAILRKHVVGYCPAERVPCRPKLDHTAVMFAKDGALFWFHLRNDEANYLTKGRH